MRPKLDLPALDELVPGSEVAVLTMRGTCCPVTRGHVMMFAEARKLLLDYPDRAPEVVQRPADIPKFAECVGLVSLNDDRRVGKKFQGANQQGLDRETRAGLVKLATAEIGWLDLNPTVTRWKDPPELLLSSIRARYPYLRLTHYDMNGADDVVKHRKWWASTAGDRSVVICRPGHTDALIAGMAADMVSPSAMLIIGPELPDISSSQVRVALGSSNGGGDEDRLAEMLHPSVLAWHRDTGFDYTAGANLLAAPALPICSTPGLVVEPRTPADLTRIWGKTTPGTTVVQFYGHSAGKPYRWFSNFYMHEPYPFVLPACCVRPGWPESVPVRFAEAAIMLCKAALFDDRGAFDAMVKAANPRYVKSLGRQVEGFTEQGWAAVVLTVAYEAVHQKFTKVRGIIRGRALTIATSFMCPACVVAQQLGSLVASWRILYQIAEDALFSLQRSLPTRLSVHRGH